MNTPDELLFDLSCSKLQLLEQELNTKITEEKDNGLNLLNQQILKCIKQVVWDFKKLEADLDPHKIAQKALYHLEKIDQQNFLLLNILEGLKSGRNLPEILETFEKIGLLSFPSAPKAAPKNAPKSWAGKKVYELKQKLGKANLLVFNVLKLGLDKLFNDTKIKPQFSLGILGPSISFSVESESSISLYELQKLMENSFNDTEG